MPPQNTAGLIRVGVLALPIAGLLVLIGMLGGLGTPDPGNDPTGAARAASTTGFFLAQFVSNMLGPTLVIFGLIALFAYLLDTRGGVWRLWRWSFRSWGSVCSCRFWDHCQRHPGSLSGVPERPAERHPDIRGHLG